MSEYYRLNHYRFKEMFVEYIGDNIGNVTADESPQETVERIIEDTTRDSTLSRMLKQIANTLNVAEAIEDLVYPSEVEVEVIHERVVRSHAYVTIEFDDKEDYEAYKAEPETYVAEHYMYDIETNEHHRDETDESFEVEEL